MYTFTELEIEYATKAWREQCYPYDELDSAVEPVLNELCFAPWLKVVRLAKFASAAQMAAKMNIPRVAWYRLEKAEANGTITLQHLNECANALECDLIYFLRPKVRKKFSSSILEKIMPEALKVKAPQFSWTRINRLGDMLIQLTHDPRFRQAQGWCRNVAGEGHAVTNMLRRIRI